jgi:hypothetical protein
MQNFEPRQEEDRLPTRRLVVSACVFLAIAGASVVVEALILHARTQAIAPVSELPPPRGTLEQTPILGSKRGPDLQAIQRASLDELGWVDVDAGVARIPIERAMALVIDEEARGR